MSAANPIRDHRHLYWIAAILAVYVALATRAIEQPGIYMDAINPDFLAARMLDPTTQTTTSMLPGNLLWKRWPLMATGLYHSSIHAYLTLPFYWALGGTVLSLRLAHLFLGIAVLTATGLFLWRTTRSKLAVACVLLALATDPGFIFTFRTQAHITTFPLVLLFACLAVLYGSAERRARHFLLAGFCIGLATWGYFIYAFAVPGVLLYIAMDRRTDRHRVVPALALFLAGACLGLLPYVVGYVSAFYRLGGIRQDLDWLLPALTATRINTHETYPARLAFALRQVFEIATGSWHWHTFFGAVEPDTGHLQTVKFVVLMLLPILSLPFALQAGRWRRAYWLVVLPVVSFVLVASLFGSRTGGHHYCLLLPLLYGMAAISLLMLTGRLANRRVSLAFAGLLCAGAVIANLGSLASFLSRLESRGGAGLYSSIFTDYPLQVRASGDRTPHIFMDWGGLMQFIYLTQGRVTAYDGSQIHAVLCAENRAKIVFIGPDALNRGLAEMRSQDLAVSGIKQCSGLASPEFRLVVLDVDATPAFCR